MRYIHPGLPLLPVKGTGSAFRSHISGTPPSGSQCDFSGHSLAILFSFGVLLAYICHRRTETAAGAPPALPLSFIRKGKRLRHMGYI